MKLSLAPILWTAVVLPLAATAACGSNRDLFIGSDCDEGLCDPRPAPSFTIPDAGADADADGAISEPEKVLACIGTECPFPYATCLTTTGKGDYTCGVNLLTDSNNCGECGNVCPGIAVFDTLRMATQCVDGKCQRECASPSERYDFKDCNGRVDDGCEVDVKSDLANCGVCGNKCPKGTDACVDGQCGCPNGMTYCGCPGGGSACGLQACKDTPWDNDNCGACGNKCKVPPDAGPLLSNMEYGCVAGECGKPKCKSLRADCDKEPENGCETNLASDPNNCGRCGVACEAGQLCALPYSLKPFCACAEGETLCSDLRVGVACTSLLSDPNNCGACGNVCPGSDPIGIPGTHGFATCRKGFCGYECEDGWADCDSDLSNGCETNLMVNTGNCGACGNRCDIAAGQPCIDGKCLMVECDGGVEVPK